MPFFGLLIKRALKLGASLEKRRLTPAQLQEKALRRLLKKAASTTFGQYYDFKELLREEDIIESFKAKVPFFDYNQIYDRWWHLALNNVENVCWPGHVRFFALSSGTSGAPSKNIPVTDDMQRAMRRAGLKMFFSLTRFDVDPELFTKGMMMLGGTTDLEEKGHHYMGDLSGINASKPPFWLRPYYKPGAEIARIPDYHSRIEEIVRKAPEWDIGFIVGIPSWLQLLMERIIEYYEVENIHQIWPHLKVCVHGGIAFEPFRKGFEKLFAHPLVYMDTYLASEGFFAFQNRPDSQGMRLLLNNGVFFEFVPFNEQNFDHDGQLLPNARSLSIDEVKTGQDYALIISSCSGAWRYIIGDTVRFLDTATAEIIISGRTKHFLSICGEHLSVDNMNQAIAKVGDVHEISIREFTVAAVPSSDGFFAHKWYIGCDAKVDSAALTKTLDEALKAVNDDYRTERSAVLDMEVHLIPTAVFYEWQEKNGKLGGQNKFPRVMKKERFQEWEKFVQGQNLHHKTIEISHHKN